MFCFALILDQPCLWLLGCDKELWRSRPISWRRPLPRRGFCSHSYPDASTENEVHYSLKTNSYLGTENKVHYWLQTNA